MEKTKFGGAREGAAGASPAQPKPPPHAEPPSPRVLASSLGLARGSTGIIEGHTEELFKKNNFFIVLDANIV